MPWERNALQENATFMKEPRRGVTGIAFTRIYNKKSHLDLRRTGMDDRKEYSGCQTNVLIAFFFTSFGSIQMRCMKMKQKTSKKMSTRTIAISGVLGAVTIMLSVTGLGMIPMPSLAGRATIMHVPVILGAILEGPVVGAFTGFIFGLYSFMTPVGAIPADPIVRILPRILIGITSYYTYVVFRRSVFGAVMAAIVGTLTNTIGYLGLATLMGYLPWAASLSILVTQMPFELLLAAVLILALYKALKRRNQVVLDDDDEEDMV